MLIILATAAAQQAGRSRPAITAEMNAGIYHMPIIYRAYAYHNQLPLVKVFSYRLLMA